MATKSQGTLIKIGANSIAEVTGINGVALNKETKDVTNLSDTFKQFISTGVVDGGEISITGFFNPNDTAGQKAMTDLLIAGTVTAFSVLWAALVADFSFNGIVTAFTVNTELEDNIGFEATIRTTGTLALGITASGGLTALSLAGILSQTIVLFRNTLSARPLVLPGSLLLCSTSRTLVCTSLVGTHQLRFGWLLCMCTE
jgi:predicted secreted protein